LRAWGAAIATPRPGAVAAPADAVLLIDSGIWIGHLRAGDADVERALMARQVLGHSFVTGELAMGSLRDRETVLGLLQALPQAALASTEEVLDLVEHRRLFSLGLGWVDAHLLASTLLTADARLWTGDRRLHDAASRFGIAA
jgi:predicted nucleic acid-binding protein